MAGPTPEQLLALNAMLQQNLQQDTAAQKLAFPVTIQTASIGIDPTAISRLLVLEGTALAAHLDQILVKTAVGEVLLKVQQTQEQQLLNLLPSRVTVQLRPGPDGLQAVLVVGSKTIIPDKPQESLSAGTALAGPTQTLAAEIPKTNKIHQALVLPSSLFSSQTPEQFLQSLVTHTQAKTAPGAPAGLPAPPTLLNVVLQKLGIQVQQVQTDTAKTALELASPATASKPSVSPQTYTPVANVNVSATAPALPNIPQTTAVKILAIITPEEAVKFSTLPLPVEDGVEIAIVRGNTPSGQPVLSIGDKLIAVQGGKNWPVGLQLKVSMGPQAGFVVAEEAEIADLHGWGGLRAAIEALAAAGQTGVITEMARMRLPQPNAQQMPGALLFFMAALQKGMPNWLGEEFIQQLKGLKKEELVRKVQEQWREQISRECEGPGGQWRGISIPLFDEARLQHMRLYIYDPPDQRGKKRKDDPNWVRRFLIDMELSRLGPVQLDGLVHKQRLELVVRTDRALQADLRKDLRERFLRTLEEVRYSGDLRFNANKMGWVDIKDKSAAPKFLKEM